MPVPSKIKQMVGKSTKPVIYEVEKGQVRRFARAIGEDAEIHLDEKAAKAAGYAGLVAPPTFASLFDHSKQLLLDMDLSTSSTMHAEEEYEYFRPICAGDVLEVVHRVADAYEKPAPNGRLVFVVLETRATDARRKAVFKGRRVLVELKS